MQVAAQLSRRFHRIGSGYVAPVCLVVLFGWGSQAAASGTDNNNFPLVDTATIASLQLRAQQAAPREQVQIYADLVDKISLLASREIADGEIEKAQETLHQLEACTAQIESGLQRDSKGLKRTELLLHTTRRRLTDMVRTASGDMKPMVQQAVARLDRAQTALLSAVFDH